MPNDDFTAITTSDCESCRKPGVSCLVHQWDWGTPDDPDEEYDPDDYDGPDESDFDQEYEIQRAEIAYEAMLDGWGG